MYRTCDKVNFEFLLLYYNTLKKTFFIGFLIYHFYGNFFFGYKVFDLKVIITGYFMRILGSYCWLKISLPSPHCDWTHLYPTTTFISWDEKRSNQQSRWSLPTFLVSTSLFSYYARLSNEQWLLLTYAISSKSPEP